MKFLVQNVSSLEHRYHVQHTVDCSAAITCNCLVGARCSSVVDRITNSQWLRPEILFNVSVPLLDSIS